MRAIYIGLSIEVPDAYTESAIGAIETYLSDQIMEDIVDWYWRKYGGTLPIDDVCFVMDDECAAELFGVEDYEVSDEDYD